MPNAPSVSPLCFSYVQSFETEFDSASMLLRRPDGVDAEGFDYEGALLGILIPVSVFLMIYVTRRK